jgi:hypothetical protein
MDAASAVDALSTRHTHSSRAAVLAKEAMVRAERREEYKAAAAIL